MINHLVTNRNKLLMTMLVVLLLALNLVYSADFPNLKDINTNEFNSSSVSVPIQQGTMLAAGDDSTVTNDSGRQNAAGKKISLNSTDSATIRKVYTTDSVIALMGKKAGFSAEQGSKFIDMIIEVESSEEKLLDINDVLSVRIREANSDTWAVPDHIAVENADLQLAPKDILLKQHLAAVAQALAQRSLDLFAAFGDGHANGRAARERLDNAGQLRRSGNKRDLIFRIAHRAPRRHRHPPAQHALGEILIHRNGAA